MSKTKLKRKAFKLWLDALCRLIIKQRDEWTCQRCGHGMDVGDSDCHWSHVEPRTTNNTHWDLLNSIALCSDCHGWWHRHPALATWWFGDKWPHRKEYIEEHVPDGFGNMKPRSEIVGTWGDQDFLDKEQELLEKAVELNVTWDMFLGNYQARFRKASKQ